MAQEIMLYRDLTVHARKKTALLFKGMTKDFCRYKQIEQGFNTRLRNLEHQVTHVVRDLARAFGIPERECTLMKLVDNLEQSVALEVRRQIVVFLNIVRQLNSVSQRSVRLTEKFFARSLKPRLSHKV